jgi:uncharacterized protein YifE (UPF0438 family)
MAEQHKKAAAAAKRYDKSKMKCNQPQRAPAGDPKKMVVKACQGGEEKIVKFGQRGYPDYTQHGDAQRRKNFHSRHGCKDKKDKMSAGYWACKKLW